MDLHIKLDSQEVLNHLKQLGYNDISPTQLREFMRDLKRLIKYDIRKQRENESRNPQSSYDASRSQESSPGYDQVDQVRRPLTCNNRLRYSLNSTGSTATSTSSGSSSSASTPTECTESRDASSQPEQLVEPKPAKKKPRPSFIRPRELSTEAPPRSDPVALYHYYQQFWKQFKQPGEDERRELRWNIRERMLGGSSSQPASKSVSRSSSLHRL